MADSKHMYIHLVSVSADMKVVSAPCHYTCTLHGQGIEHLCNLGLIAGDDLQHIRQLDSIYLTG